MQIKQTVVKIIATTTAALMSLGSGAGELLAFYTKSITTLAICK